MTSCHGGMGWRLDLSTAFLLTQTRRSRVTPMVIDRGGRPSGHPWRHQANAPADATLLRGIPEIPGSLAAAEFFAAHDGALLFTDADTRTEGVTIFSISEWAGRTAQMVESWVDGEYSDDDMPYGRNDFIAFAHSRGASSHIHWVTRGPRTGAVYWWPWAMPPDRDAPPVTTDFGEFLRLLYERPVYFFNKVMLCYARFSDGRTSTEWMPSRYVPDRGKPLEGR